MALSPRVSRLFDPVLIVALFLWLAMVTRFAGLELTVTADEGYWMHRTVRFGVAVARGDPESTFRSGHPGVALMWVGLLGIGPGKLAVFDDDRYVTSLTLEHAPAFREAFWWARYAVAVAASGLLAIAVALVWKLLGPGAAIAAGLLLLLDPYAIGMSRLLHVDALLAPLMTVSALAGLVYWLADRRWRFLVVSGTAAGLAVLTKAPAAFLIPFFGLLALFSARPWATGWRALAPLGVWAALLVATVFALWPVLWVEPLATIERVAQFTIATGLRPHDAANFLLGRILREDPGPLFYPVSLAFRLGPVALLGTVAAAIVLAWRRTRATPLLWMAAYVALFVGCMTIGPKKFDRYMLPAVWMLDLAAGAALWILAANLPWRRAAFACLAILVAIQTVMLWSAYPYPIAFYNPLAGGPTAARQSLLVGWGEGLDQAAAYLNSLPNANRLLVASHYNHVVRPRFLGSTIAMRPYMRPQAPGAEPPTPNYFVFYVTSAQRRSIPPEARPIIASGKPEFVARVNGEPYAWVYRVPGSPDYSRETLMPDNDAEEYEDE